MTGLIDSAAERSALAGMIGLSKNLMLAVMIIMTGIGILVFAAELYMGIKGLNREKGTGTGHIAMGKIAYVSCIILLVVSGLALISNISNASIMDWLDILNPLVSCMIAGGYLKAAKEVG